MQLAQAHLRSANSNLVLIESGCTLVAAVTCDTSRVLTLFVLVWLARVWLVVFLPVVCVISRLMGRPRPGSGCGYGTPILFSTCVL